MNLCNKAPVKRHSLNNSNRAQCKSKLKQILLRDKIIPIFLNDIINHNKLRMSSIQSSSKVTPKLFYCSRFKINEKNNKLFCAKFNHLLNRKLEHVPNTDNECKTDT